MTEHFNLLIRGGTLVDGTGDARRAGEPQPDPDERIEQALVPLSEIPERIAAGEITHALVITAFHLYGRH